MKGLGWYRTCFMELKWVGDWKDFLALSTWLYPLSLDPIPRFWKLFLRLSYTITPKSLLHAEHISRYFAKHFAFVAQKFMKIWLILSRCSEASRSIKGLLMEKWIIKHFCPALLAAFELIELQPSCELRCSIHYRNTYTLLSIRYCGQGASSHPQSHKVSLQSLGNYGGFSPLNIFIR